MLEIKNIVKDYPMKDEVVHALKGLNVSFRRNEFVAILGPSGCGKTTLLNIIGGLDRYTSGDLCIDGISTKDFKDKDWDNYRNHKVGFVFQTYNLIPHQTILENVELALTLSGVKKKERRKRAIEVLTKVGLADRLKSRPNQLSGGQMQRVAIARALVNDPEIILADEPTGALDSKTSVQIMDLLKEVSKDRLVIMVTHNPDLAKEYANRTIKLLDGEMIEDSNPYEEKELKKEIEKHLKQENKLSFKKTQKKKSMSLLMALSLSFKNLLTKKGRTTLVAFAGSIGIIGIALILAVSTGMTGYISNMQSESLSSYPMSVSSISLNLSNMTNAEQQKIEVEDDEVIVYDILETLKDYGKYNYISAEFVDYITNYYKSADKKDNINAINTSYASEMHLLTEMKKTTLATVAPTVANLISDENVYYPLTSEVSFSAMGGSTSSIFFEGLEQKDYVLSLYNVIGEYPKNKNEVALVLNAESVTSTAFVSYGMDMPTAVDSKINLNSFIGKKYKLLLNDEYYNQTTNDVNDKYKSANLISSQTNLKTVFDNETANTEELTVTCVLKLKDDASGSIFSDGIMYSTALKEFYRANCKTSQIVENIKTIYALSAGTTANGDALFTANNLKNYTVNISELSMLKGMGLSIDENAYNYSSLYAMKQALHSYFDISLTDAQLIDLYLQMYGASDVPTGVYIYLASFDAKDDFFNMIDAWNAREGVFKVDVSDSTGVLTNLLSGIVNIISYVLIAFASISLVVSSLMIAIITYTSVIERTKEIGVLRSVGASKRDVSRVFNAETIIIGLFAGLIGIGISLLLTLPISAILKSFTGIANLAYLKVVPCVTLIVISVLLTLVAGLIPARIASKKDPVKALRSE